MSRLSRVSSPLMVKAAYRAQQMSLLLPALVLQRAMRVISRRGFTVEKEATEAVRRRYNDLLETDLSNAAEGLYPTELLFQFPFLDYMRAFPKLVRDVPRTLRRLRTEDFTDLPGDVDVMQYPAYYRRTFHWQTDGYFSIESAARYDVGVELLFLGTADVMRRQLIPHVTRYLRGRDGDEPARLLDVACGTGRALGQLAIAHPELRLIGLDLSPYYIRQARELLADYDNVSLLAENGESIPFRDGYVDVATSVFLFHELPKDARRRVMSEMFRVVRPGGLAIIIDSAQPSESPDLAPFLSRFTADFHEPYYKGYLRDPLETALADTGFEPITVQRNFVSKLVVARKPA